ncbi:MULTISPECIES: tripartite tricarboxylate transporter substrate-binding protein [Ramlibacter]|uniref:tripartite tricarboxylate transporter substrate-binding protein n=1 Tax=Ramlibacter TaxID=174951 RepID=UPI0012FAE863|nr:tripartite tricarboxylate transporter substrate binding protein [Ramlibacter sp. CGMCC 1.13660]
MAWRAGARALAALAWVAGSLLAAPAQAQAPAVPAMIKIWIPFAPGGPTDVFGRLAADALRTNLKTTVVTENRPGGNGAVAVNALKLGPADGSNLLFVSSGMITFSPFIDKSMAYDPQRDLVPIVCIAQTDIGLILATNVQATNLQEFLQLARRSNPPLSMGSAGLGNILHAYIELFKDATRVDLLHVPYKGASPAFADVLAGQISGMFIAVGLAQPSVAAGKARLIATVGKRSELAPGVPTLAEQGIPGVEILPWFAIMGPRGMAPETVERIAAAVRAAAGTEDFKKRLSAAGASPLVVSGPEFTRMIDAESQTWSRLITEKKLKAE